MYFKENIIIGLAIEVKHPDSYDVRHLNLCDTLEKFTVSHCDFFPRFTSVIINTG